MYKSENRSIVGWESRYRRMQFRLHIHRTIIPVILMLIVLEVILIMYHHNDVNHNYSHDDEGKLYQNRQSIERVVFNYVYLYVEAQISPVSTLLTTRLEIDKINSQKVSEFI